MSKLPALDRPTPDRPTSLRSIGAAAAFATFVCSTAWAPAAHADSGAAAGALFRQARDDAARGNYDQACPRFAESLRLVPTIGTMLNLGDCQEHRGRLADALEQFRRALEAMSRSDDRIGYTRDRVAKLTARVPHIRLRGSAEETLHLSVELDGVELSDAAIGVPIPVNPGRRTIVVRATGRQDRPYAVQLAEGASVDLEIAPGPPAPSTPLLAGGAGSTTATGSGATPPGAERTTPHRSQPWRTIEWPALIVGSAGIVVGATTGVLALSAASRAKDHCPNHVCSNASDVDDAKTGHTYSTISTVSLAVGVVGVGVAAYSFWRSAHDGTSSDKDQRTTSSHLSPLVGPSLAGISFSKSFQ